MVYTHVFNQGLAGADKSGPTQCARAVTINPETRPSPNILGLDIPRRLASGGGAKFASKRAWSWLRLTPPSVLSCEGRSITRDTRVLGIRSWATQGA